MILGEMEMNIEYDRHAELGMSLLMSTHLQCVMTRIKKN